MADDTNEFYHELKTCLESFRQQEALPKVDSLVKSLCRSN